MIYLHKILPILVSPIFLFILLLAIGLWSGWTWPILVTIIYLWLCSMPIIGDHLASCLEGGQIRRSIENVPNADAIVVLGGTLTTVAGEDGFVTQWMDANRFFGGIELKKAGKADLLIFTRGQLPWASNSVPDGEVFRKKAIELGVAEHSIHLTGLVTNTDEEAREVAQLLKPTGKTNILLVTSAYHMSRARHVFEARGLKTIPFPVGFIPYDGEITPMRFLPDATALENTSLFHREMVGRLYYRLRGTFGG